jgi:hypothetical protein
LSGQIDKFTIGISHVVRSSIATNLVRVRSALQRAADLFILPCDLAGGLT